LLELLCALELLFGTLLELLCVGELFGDDWLIWLELLDLFG
jgi:hypothetical protein